MIIQIKDILRKNSIYYIIACLTALVLNVLYRSNDSSLLTWILAPTARWAGILGGMYFEPFPGKGYVNETFRFLIAPSCSGIRFLQIVLLMLVFSYTHRIAPGRRKALWLPFCFIFSYISTVLVNGLRIVLSIYTPFWMENASLSLRILTPKMLHTLIGSAVYFSSLLMLQPLAAALSARLFCKTDALDNRKTVPVLCYFLAVLGLPFVKRLVTGNLENFGSYALPILLACSCILLLARGLRKHA